MLYAVGMEQPSPAVERARLIVVIVLRIIAAAALLRSLWWTGAWISWGLYDNYLIDSAHLQTWFAMGLYFMLGVGILVNLDWLTRALVPLQRSLRTDPNGPPTINPNELIAAMTLAAVRFAGGSQIVYGLWTLAISVSAMEEAIHEPSQGVGWMAVGYLIPIFTDIITGSLFLVFDRRIALWLRCDRKPSDLSPSDHSV